MMRMAMNDHGPFIFSFSLSYYIWWLPFITIKDEELNGWEVIGCLSRHAITGVCFAD